MFKGQASYCCLLNKQEISSTVPTMKRERLLSWRAGSHWRETEVHCLCWEADWDLLFFDQRHNKITSLPLSTTSTFDSFFFFWSHPHPLLPPVKEEKETEGAFRCLKNFPFTLQLLNMRYWFGTISDTGFRAEEGFRTCMCHRCCRTPASGVLVGCEL